MRICGRTRCEAGPQPDFVLRILGQSWFKVFGGFPKKQIVAISLLPHHEKFRQQFVLFQQRTSLGT